LLIHSFLSNQEQSEDLRLIEFRRRIFAPLIDPFEPTLPGGLVGIFTDKVATRPEL